MGREDEGVSSSRPELVALAECLEDHDDDVSLLYLTDSEVILQDIHRWIGCGAKLNLFHITRCGRPQENYNQITEESSSGSSDIASESQSQTQPTGQYTNGR